MRLSGYDDSQNGLYFITICVNNRQELLGEIAPVGNDTHIVPCVELSEYGIIVKKYI